MTDSSSDYRLVWLILLYVTGVLVGCSQRATPVFLRTPASEQCKGVWILRDQILSAEQESRMYPYTAGTSDLRKFIFDKAEWCDKNPMGMWL